MRNWNCVCVSINWTMMNNNEKKILICFKLKKWSKTKAAKKNYSRKCFSFFSSSSSFSIVIKLFSSLEMKRGGRAENIIKFLFSSTASRFRNWKMHIRKKLLSTSHTYAHTYTFLLLLLPDKLFIQMNWQKMRNVWLQDAAARYLLKRSNFTKQLFNCVYRK